MLSNRKALDEIVHKLSDINDKVISFFNKYPLQGSKVLNYQDFCKIAMIMKDKSHLILEGLEEIRKIKSVMNKARYK